MGVRGNMNKNNRIMSNNFFMFRSVMKYTPSFFVIHVLNSLFYGIVFNSATLLFTKNLYEQIETQINTQKSDFGIIVKLFMFIVIINGVAFLIDSFLNKYYFPIITNKLSEKMQTEISVSYTHLYRANAIWLRWEIKIVRCRSI